MAEIDIVTGSVSKSVDFLQKNYKELLVEFAKLLLLTWGVMIACFIVVGLVAGAMILTGVLSLSGFSFGAPIIIVLAALALVVFFAISVFAASLGFVKYNIVEKFPAKVPFIDSARMIIKSVAVYEALFFLLLLAVFGIPIVLILVLKPRGILILLSILLVVLAFLAMIVIGFFLQFVPLEIAINKAGGLEAIKRSIALVRRNILATFIYDLAIFVISFVVGTIFGIFLQVLSFGFVFAVVFFPLFILIAIFYFVVILVQSIIVSTITVPVVYNFWKVIGGKK